MSLLVKCGPPAARELEVGTDCGKIVAKPVRPDHNGSGGSQAQGCRATNACVRCGVDGPLHQTRTIEGSAREL